MEDKERVGRGVGEKNGRRFRGPRGSLTNSSTRAEGISEASEGQMQLRERANQRVNKVAGPHGSEGMPRNHYCLDGEDRCGQEEREWAFLSQERTGKCREWLRKHSLCGEEKKGIAKVNSGSWKKPGKGWSCQMVGMWAVTRESRERRAESSTPTPAPTGQNLQVGSPASPNLAWASAVLSHSIVSDSCDPMDCSPPGSSVHGIIQARILEGVAMPSSRRSSQPRDQTQVCHIAGRFFTIWATREAHIGPTSPSSSRLPLSCPTGSWSSQTSAGLDWRHSSMEYPPALGPCHLLKVTAACFTGYKEE